MAIVFEELEGSPTIQIDGSVTLAKRVFRVAWVDWRAFAEQLVGGWKKVGTSYRHVEPIPFPGMKDVIVRSLDVEPFGAINPDGTEVESISQGTNIYPNTGAKVTVTYVPSQRVELEFAPSAESGTHIRYRLNLGTELVSTPSRAWVWDDDLTKVPDDVNPGILMPTGSFTVGWDFVASPPWTAIRNLRGKVNDASFFNAPIGKVLFLGARIHQQFEFLHLANIFSIEYEFAERIEDWNKVFKPGTGFTGIEHGAGGNPPFASGSFDTLFQFE